MDIILTTGYNESTTVGYATLLETHIDLIRPGVLNGTMTNIKLYDQEIIHIFVNGKIQTVSQKIPLYTQMVDKNNITDRLDCIWITNVTDDQVKFDCLYHLNSASQNYEFFKTVHKYLNLKAFW